MRRLNDQKEYPPVPTDFLERNKGRFDAVGQKHGLMLLYAHGSVATGNMGSLSDIDIAVMFDPSQEEKGFFERHGALHADLAGIFGRDDIDISELNSAPPLLRYLAARGGKCLYARSDNERVMFEFHAIREYLDTIQLRHIYWQGLTAAVESGKFYS